MCGMGRPRKAIPDQWVPVFTRAGIESYADLANKSGVKRSTITALLDGIGNPTQDTVERAAQALQTTPQRLREIRGDGRRTPFDVPTDADLMTRHQQDVVRSLIVEFVNTEKRLARLDQRRQVAVDDAEVSGSGAGRGIVGLDPDGDRTKKGRSRGTDAAG